MKLKRIGSGMPFLCPCLVIGALAFGFSCTARSQGESELGPLHKKLWQDRQGALDRAQEAINQYFQNNPSSRKLPSGILDHMAAIDAWGGLQYDDWQDVVDSVGDRVELWEQWYREGEHRKETLSRFYQAEGEPLTLNSPLVLRDTPVPLPRCADASPVPVQVETLLSSSGSVMRQGRSHYSLHARNGFVILQTPSAINPNIRHDASCIGENRYCNGMIEDRCQEGYYCGAVLYASGRVRSSCGPHEDNNTNYDRDSRPISFRWRLFRDVDDDF